MITQSPMLSQSEHNGYDTRFVKLNELVQSDATYNFTEV